MEKKYTDTELKTLSLTYPCGIPHNYDSFLTFLILNGIGGASHLLHSAGHRSMVFIRLLQSLTHYMHFLVPVDLLITGFVNNGFLNDISAYAARHLKSKDSMLAFVVFVESLVRLSNNSDIGSIIIMYSELIDFILVHVYQTHLRNNFLSIAQNFSIDTNSEYFRSELLSTIQKDKLL